MIKFPLTLPAPLISSDNISQSPTNDRTKMASGRSRQRRVRRIATANTQFSFIFTAKQVLEFEKWFTEECNSGAEWFEIRRLTSSGYVPLKARFKSMYKGATKIGLTDTWGIKFEAEAFNIPIDIPIWEFPDYIKNQCLLDCIVNVKWPPRFPEFVRRADVLDYTTNKLWPEYDDDSDTSIKSQLDELKEGVAILKRGFNE